jgi:hypothetical protein
LHNANIQLVGLSVTYAIFLKFKPLLVLELELIFSTLRTACCTPLVGQRIERNTPIVYTEPSKTTIENNLSARMCEAVPLSATNAPKGKESGGESKSNT